MATLLEKHADVFAPFGNRASADPDEMILYGHDVGVLPPLVNLVTASTTPQAVVQPVSEEEVTQVLSWAAQNRIPVTPRGKATAGYGGAVPYKKGVVVDFYRMRQVLNIDKEGMTVTVQPGISWEQLDTALMKEGLTLRLYPTSYPSSSVGGWLAQGGAGIGSYEYGYFKENVTAARVALPDGSVKELSGDDLDLVSDAEGITGLITAVTVKIKEAEPLSVMAVACKTALELQQFAQAISDNKINIWSLLFVNPRMADLKNRAPLRQHLGHAAEEHTELPQAYIAVAAYHEKDGSATTGALRKTASAIGGTVLSDELAMHEWENRFNVMLIKRLGPSLVPSEVIVPLDRLAVTLEAMDSSIHQPIVKEGIAIRQGRGGKAEVVILGFIPADQRSLFFNFIFGLSLSIIKIAEDNGGRAYSTGMFFTNKRNDILGKERVAALRSRKKAVDPRGILNPGKVLENGLFGVMMPVSGMFEPVIRLFGNAVKTRIGERLPVHDRKEIPADVAWYAYACAQCGYCLDTCDQFFGRGWESQNPRGKWYWIRQYIEGKVKWNQKMVDSIIACTTCELCNHRCSAKLPIEQSWMKLRGKLIHEKKKMTFPPFEMMTAALTDQGNIWAGYRKNRGDWFPEELRAKHGPGVKAKAVYFAGCTASYVEDDIGIASVHLLDKAGVDFTYLGERESCCATPMLVAGKWDAFKDTMKKNIAAVKESGADTVICSCPACDMMWRHAYPEWAQKLGIKFDLNVKHYSEVVTEKIAAGEFSFPDTGRPKQKVAWHDSCHMGRVSEVYEPPRDLIKAVPHAELVEMASNRETGKCCGSVLTLIKDPDVAADIGKDRLDEAVEVDAEKVLALCPCCQFQLRVSRDAKDVPVQVEDLSHFAADALGIELPDPEPEVRRQWAVFEAMIALMTPKGFAELMGTMWPEMISAMPFGMGPMMRVMGKVPGALNLMKPFFPILFPRLLPMMMPKVMPTMLARVADKVPMPDYMAEQMPALMPKVMDNLMPHMIGDVVPLVTQPMIDYLQGKSNGRNA